MITLRALECLVAIIDAGSLTKAAAALHMSQPALSHQIASLEGELDTRLVERLARGIRPTAAGLAVAEEARSALESAARAVAAGRSAATGEGGRIRIACVETMTAWVLVPVLRHWRRWHPDVELDLKEFTSADDMLRALQAGRADVTIGPPPTRIDEYFEVLGSEEIVVVASPRHRFSQLDNIAAGELESEPLVHYDPNNGMAIWLDQFAAERGALLPEPVLRTGSPRTAAQLASVGMGVAVVPFSALTGVTLGTFKSFDPPEHRDILVIVAAPHDALVGRFVADLRRRGLPESAITPR